MRGTARRGERSRTGETTKLARVVALAAIMVLSVTTLRAQSPDELSAQSSDQPQNAAEAQPASAAQADPPARVVRLGLMQGAVSAEPAGANAFTAAELNQVLTTGDRIYTDTEAYAELQAAQLAVRLGGATDLTVTAMTDQVAQFGLAAGSAHLRSYAIPAGTVLELDTPEAAMTVLQPGDLRVDEDADGHVTTISVLSGQVQVDGPQGSQQLNAGERLRIHGANAETGEPGSAESLPSAGTDALDGFSDGRDNLYANGAQGYGDFVNPDTIGGADLAGYGSWDVNVDFGPVWFPGVSVDWRPYCEGHWRWVSPWGWTWVGHEPWAFAPFHYGRWVFVDGRWGWLPGPPRLHPVYAPALVAFVGGKQLSADRGHAPGSGIAAWFPLGPHDPYAPWYRGSTLYLNRVNASNLPNRNTAEARAFYNQRAVNVYANHEDGTGTRPPYANRSVGTVAVAQESFAAGHSVARNQLRLSAGELAAGPVLAHPGVGPERSMMSTAPARAVPMHIDRPLQAEHRDSRHDAEGAVSGQQVNRPAFFHAPPPSLAIRPGSERQPRTMERTDTIRPQPGHAERPVPQGAVMPREAGPHPAAVSHPVPAPTPARSAPTQPAPGTPHR